MTKSPLTADVMPPLEGQRLTITFNRHDETGRGMAVLKLKSLVESESPHWTMILHAAEWNELRQLAMQGQVLPVFIGKHLPRTHKTFGEVAQDSTFFVDGSGYAKKAAQKPRYKRQRCPRCGEILSLNATWETWEQGLTHFCADQPVEVEDKHNMLSPLQLTALRKMYTYHAAIQIIEGLPQWVDDQTEKRLFWPWTNELRTPTLQALVKGGWCTLAHPEIEPLGNRQMLRLSPAGHNLFKQMEAKANGESTHV
ncbi:MAG: hypothetical protein BroJett011_42870 [Chloroflexota bacterium]|nr:MAG: hypothetical protein BroJett011_42870 [Chloroflexota bacterium]